MYVRLKRIQGNAVRNYMPAAYIQSSEPVEHGLLLTRVLAMPTHPSNLYPTPCHAIIGFTRGRLSTLCLQGDANFPNAYVSNRWIRDNPGFINSRQFAVHRDKRPGKRSILSLSLDRSFTIIYDITYTYRNHPSIYWHQIGSLYFLVAITHR